MAYTNIDFPAEYFDTKLYTGDGTTNQTITGINFKPDFNWIKLRSSAHQHTLTDAVRGLNKGLLSNSTSAETTDYQYGWLSSFNSDGFTTQKGSGIAYNVNQSGETYVSWNWLGSNTTVSNTSGTITSTVSANTTSGFSIVSYTGNGTSGATVGHGIGSTIGMMLVKGRSFSDNWAVYHKSIGGTGLLELNGTGGTNTVSTRWNDTNAGATVFTLGNNSQVNGNGSTYIAYCFAEVKGFSKFGSYVGNGSTDGTFIYTGFKPAFVMVKASSTTGQWAICDTKRGVAPSGEFLFAEDSGATNSAPANWDFLSNGFKARANYAAHNTSGVTHIYMAFAENPFVSSKGIPTTAR